MYRIPEYANIYWCGCDVTSGNYKLISHEPERLLPCSFLITGNSETYLHNKCSNGWFQLHNFHLALVFIKPVTRYLNLNISKYCPYYFYVLGLFCSCKIWLKPNRGLFWKPLEGTLFRNARRRQKRREPAAEGLSSFVSLSVLVSSRHPACLLLRSSQQVSYNTVSCFNIRRDAVWNGAKVTSVDKLLSTSNCLRLKWDVSI